MVSLYLIGGIAYAIYKVFFAIERFDIDECGRYISGLIFLFEIFFIEFFFKKLKLEKLAEIN